MKNNFTYINKRIIAVIVCLGIVFCTVNISGLDTYSSEEIIANENIASDSEIVSGEVIEENDLKNEKTNESTDVSEIPVSEENADNENGFGESVVLEELTPSDDEITNEEISLASDDEVISIEITDDIDTISLQSIEDFNSWSFDNYDLNKLINAPELPFNGGENKAEWINNQAKKDIIEQLLLSSDLSITYVNSANQRVFYSDIPYTDSVASYNDKLEAYYTAQNIVSEIIADDMSDIEKYFRLYEFLIRRNTVNKNNLWKTKTIAMTSRAWIDYLEAGNVKYGGQSAYDILVGKDGLQNAVCTGMSHAYQMLCHVAGLKCICVSNTTHMWNLVSVNGCWYSVDTLNGGFLRSSVQYGSEYCAGGIILENYLLDKNDTYGKHDTKYGYTAPFSSSSLQTSDMYGSLGNTFEIKNITYDIWKQYAMDENPYYEEKGSGTGHREDATYHWNPLYDDVVEFDQRLHVTVTESMQYKYGDYLSSCADIYNTRKEYIDHHTNTEAVRPPFNNYLKCFGRWAEVDEPVTLEIDDPDGILENYDLETGECTFTKAGSATITLRSKYFDYVCPITVKPQDNPRKSNQRYWYEDGNYDTYTRMVRYDYGTAPVSIGMGESKTLLKRLSYNGTTYTFPTELSDYQLEYDPSIISINPTPQELKITGLKAGTTHLRLFAFLNDASTKKSTKGTEEDISDIAIFAHADMDVTVSLDMSKLGFTERTYRMVKGETLSNIFIGSDFDATFTSGNEDIASIDENGTITANSPGRCTLNAQITYEGVTNSFSTTLIVYDPALYVANTVMFTDEETSTLKIKNGYGRATFTSSDTSVIKIEQTGDDMATAKIVGCGTTTITATSMSKTLTEDITVYSPCKFKKSSYTINAGGSYFIDRVMFENFDILDNYSLYSSNTNVFEVNKQTAAITPKTVGSGTLTLITNGKSYSTSIKVIDPKLSGIEDLFLDGKTYTFKVSGGNGTTEWSSSDTSVVTITSKGVATPKAEGNATIYAVNNGKILSMNVKIHRVPRFLTKSMTVNAGDVITIDENCFDFVDCTDAIFDIGKTKVAKVTGNEITTLTKGKFTVTVNAGGRKFTCPVTVYDPAIKGADIIYLGKPVSFSVTNGVKDTEWSVGDESITTVDAKGKVVPVSEGKTTITAVNNGRTMTREIEVHRTPKFLEKSYTINADEVFVIDDFVFDGAGFTDGQILYDIGKCKTATLEGNVITPIKAGKITVTVTIDKKKYKTTVTVYDPQISGQDIFYLGKSASLKVTNGAKLTEWLIDDENIATIDTKGKVTPVSEGRTVITAINNGRTISKNIEVHHTPKFLEKSYTINADEVFVVDDMVFDFAGFVDGQITYDIGKCKTATLEGNVITPIKAGKITVTATIDKKKYKTTVTVYDPQISGQSIFYLGKSAGLKITNGAKLTEWLIDDENIATIDAKGKVVPVSEGKTTITAVNNGRTMTREIEVHRIPKFLEKAYTINAGETFIIDDTVFDFAGFKDEQIAYDIGTCKTATIEGNVITPIKNGKITVTATIDKKKYKTTLNVL